MSNETEYDFDRANIKEKRSGMPEKVSVVITIYWDHIYRERSYRNKLSKNMNLPCYMTLFLL